MGDPDRKRTRSGGGNDENRKVSRPRTRSESQGDRAAAVAARKAAEAAEAEVLRQRRQQALANLPLAAPGNRGDGKLYIAFIQVGQGDCIVVSTPASRVLVFDCGSTGTDGEVGFKARVKSTLRGAKFLRGTNTIDVLVLTHPDRDHYNQLEEMLGVDFTIDVCYHSLASDQYAEKYTSSWVKNQMSDVLHVKQVVHNNDQANGNAGQVSLNGQPVQPATDADTVDRLDGQGGIRIVDEPNCKISIIAAGVTQVYNVPADGDPKNTASIVTLIEAFGKKILLCGDATFNTEQYLMNTALNRLQNLTVLQIGHHASKVTSSGKTFVRQVNPWAAVASAGRNIVTYHLPSSDVIIRYQIQLTLSNLLQINEHETFFWEGNEGGYQHESNWEKYQVFSTGSRGTVEFTFEAAQ
jgi:beta-lactamase superfamily II metal-dependent hydrolase